MKERIAEANPSIDVLGYDTACKILILVNVIMYANIKLEKIDKVALKKAVKIENNVAKFNGVEIPGLTVTEREDKFTVR